MRQLVAHACCHPQPEPPLLPHPDPLFTCDPLFTFTVHPSPCPLPFVLTVTLPSPVSPLTLHPFPRTLTIIFGLTLTLTLTFALTPFPGPRPWQEAERPGSRCHGRVVSVLEGGSVQLQKQRMITLPHPPPHRHRVSRGGM